MRTQRQHGMAMFHTVRWVLRQLGFAYFRLRLRGLQHIPRQGGAIIAGNHPSILDGILLLIVSPRPVRFLVAEELFYHPFLRWAFEGMGCMPVYRTRTNNGDALRAAVAALASGEVIGLFPEGTTSDEGRMRTVRRGVGLLALKTGAPVIPMGIWGSAEGYPHGARPLDSPANGGVARGRPERAKRVEGRLPRPCQITVAFAPAIRYVKTAADPIPAAMLQRTLDDVRSEILHAMEGALQFHIATLRPWWLKRWQVAFSALIVVPLAGLLSLTANPSLDPADGARPA